MIQQKIDIRYVIKSLNELEKLKLLLFDKDQYSLFEHIPKPILFEKGMLFGVGDKSNGNDEEKFLLTNGSGFWNKDIGSKNVDKNFGDALRRIRKKENPNVIDQRLIAIIEDFNS